jgi:nucleoside-diphosphate-sugar epimerase
MKPLYRLDDLRGRRILVTGGAGMIGSTIARLAADRGAEVTVFDALLAPYGGNPFNLDGYADRIRFVRGDIRDAEAVARALEPAEIVFSLAAQVSYLSSNTDPFLDLEINARGQLVLLEACRKAGGERRLLFPSSRFVYGTIERSPVDEGHPLNCRSVYGIHKLAGEKYYRLYHDLHGLRTVSLRISNPYGPRQQMKHSQYGIVNWFVRQALEGRPLTIYGDGAQVRDYVFVEEVAEAFLATALRSSFDGDVLNVGSGVGTPFREMVETVAKVLPGTRIEQVEWPPDRVLNETGDYVADLSRIRALTGWAPRVPLEEGIRTTVEYYRRHRDRYW